MREMSPGMAFASGFIGRDMRESPWAQDRARKAASREQESPAQGAGVRPLAPLAVDDSQPLTPEQVEYRKMRAMEETAVQLRQLNALLADGFDRMASATWFGGRR